MKLGKIELPLPETCEECFLNKSIDKDLWVECALATGERWLATPGTRHRKCIIIPIPSEETEMCIPLPVARCTECGGTIEPSEDTCICDHVTVVASLSSFNVVH